MVFREGSLVEYGSHKELYEKGGIYTEMFDKQAQFYRDEKSSDIFLFYCAAMLSNCCKLTPLGKHF